MSKREAAGVQTDPASRRGTPGTPGSCEPISDAELARAGLNGWTRKLSKTNGKHYYASPGSLTHRHTLLLGAHTHRHTQSPT